jgi:hypothetical protein
VGRRCGRPFYLGGLACRRERRCYSCCLLIVVSVQGSLFFYGSSVLGLDITKEVVSCGSLRDPKCVVGPIDPPQLYPATPFSVEGDRMEPLGRRGLGVVPDCFFLRDVVVRDCSPLDSAIYVSFGGSNPPFVESVRLEVPTVFSPLCQGVRGEILVLM